LQARAASRAGDAQARTADQQIGESRRQFDVIQGLLQPYVQAGNVALQAQLDLIGIGGGGTAPAIEVINVPGAPGGGGSGGFTPNGILNGIIGGNGSISMPANQPGSGGAPGFQQFRVGDQTFNTMADAQAYANANRTGGLSPDRAQQQAIARLANGAQFRALADQGEYALNANAAATGGLRGGNQQAALAQFRPQMLQSLIDRQIANLGGIAANGQNAAGQTGTAAQNTAGMVNAALGDRGAAQAGAALAGGQAWANAGSGILNTVGMLAQPTTPGGGLWQRWQF
jgi:hypothetical protein